MIPNKKLGKEILEKILSETKEQENIFNYANIY